MSGLICMLTCDKNPKNLIFLLPLLLLVTTGGMAQQSTRVGDALDISVLLKGGPAKKREAFSRVFKQERKFIDSILKAGLKLPRASGN